MKNVIRKGWLAALLLASNGVYAQYTELLQPQKAEHAEQMKSNKYLRVILGVRTDAAGSEMPAGAMYYNADGRLERSVSKTNKKYYTFDGTGRIVAILDSAHDGRRFMKVEYAFTYGPDGKLQSMRKDKAVSTFSYDGASRTLTEECTLNGQPVYTRRFVYNEENKIVRDERRMAGATEDAETIKYNYNKYGDLASQVHILSKTASLKDSTVTMITYDGKGRPISKRTSYGTITTDPANPAAPATHQTIKTETLAFTYNAKGQLVKEACTSTRATESYILEYEFDNAGIIMSELRKSPTGQFISKQSYSYYRTK